MSLSGGTFASSDGISTVTPTLLLGYAATRKSRNVVHEILGLAAPVMTYQPSLLRAGEFKLLFETQGPAVAAHNAFSNRTTTWTYAFTDNTVANMTFAVAEGNVSIELVADTDHVYTVTFPFQETT